MSDFNKGIVVIGDVHGKLLEYYQIRKKAKQTIQVGDFGFQEHHDWHLRNIHSGNHLVNFGNHDYTPYVNKPHSCGHFQYFPEWNLMTIRGALTIDKHRRDEGIDYFSDEELNYSQMNDAIDLYVKTKPEIVITHDCPQSVMEHMFDHFETEAQKSITRQGLQSAFELHQPAMWVFGHHHKSRNQMINGTRFICLAELETFNI